MQGTGANLALKQPFVYSSNSHAAARAAALAVGLGHGLPCRVVEVLIGPLVVVEFDINSIFNLPKITMPVAGLPQYFRAPLQVGDVGRAMPTGTQLSKIAGIDTATPNMGRQGNLATLAFEPISSKNWPTITGFDPKAAYVYGAGSGVVIQDAGTGEKTVVKIDKDKVIITVATGKIVTVTAGGTPHFVATSGGSGVSTVLKADS